MLDVKYVLANLDKVIEGLRFRNANVDFDKLRELSTERREKCQRYDQLRFEQRQASDQMRSLSKEEAVELRNQLKAMSSELKALDRDRRRTRPDDALYPEHSRSRSAAGSRRRKQPRNPPMGHPKNICL